MPEKRDCWSVSIVWSGTEHMGKFLIALLPQHPFCFQDSLNSTCVFSTFLLLSVIGGVPGIHICKS